MRIVTRKAVAALMNGKTFSSKNTQVQDGCMYLYGKPIARLDSDSMIISTCGWNTLTTRERLNGLPNVKVFVKRGQLYLNDFPWDGRQIAIHVQH